MKRLAIIGSGDLGQQIAHHAITDKQFEVVGFFDDFKSIGEKVNSIPVLGKVENVYSRYKEKLFDFLLIGIGYKHLDFRAQLYNDFNGAVPFARLIHSSCIVDPSAVINEGVVIYPGCVIDQEVTIGANVLLNICCSISHHSEIKAHTFLSPRVAIAGFVSVGFKCNIGINSSIIDNITIVDETRIGGGGVIIKNIDKKGLYVGNPVRFVR